MERNHTEWSRSPKTDDRSSLSEYFLQLLFRGFVRNVANCKTKRVMGDSTLEHDKMAKLRIASWNF